MTPSRSIAKRCAASRRWLAVPAVALLMVGCSGLDQAMTAHTDVVARAAGQELRVSEAAELIGSNPQIPADPQMVRVLADIWVDYTLLAQAVAEDPNLGMLDMEEFTRPMREQAVMTRLRDEVVTVDTVFTEEQLQEEWRTEGPGAEIRARHILLRVPAEATPAQRDSVRQLAASLRDQARAGADFATLAAEYSQDPGSAVRGGDLDYFGRGRMVAPFEEVAFALEPGEVSDVVETPFGYHVIRLEDRRQADLSDQREEFRQFLVQRAHQQAEASYLDSLSAAANVQVTAGGVSVVREIASRPEVALRGRAADREIASYEGGAYTTGEFAEFIRAQPPQTQSMFATASDEQLESAVQQLVRIELLMREARERGIALTREEEEELMTQMREELQRLLQATGFTNFAGQQGNAAAIHAHVQTLIAEGVAGRAQLVPLGPLGFALRDRYPSEINEGTFSQVIAALEQIRARQLPAEQPGLTQPQQPQQPQLPPQSPPAQEQPQPQPQQ